MHITSSLHSTAQQSISENWRIQWMPDERMRVSSEVCKTWSLGAMVKTAFENKHLSQKYLYTELQLGITVAQVIAFAQSLLPNISNKLSNFHLLLLSRGGIPWTYDLWSSHLFGYVASSVLIESNFLVVSICFGNWDIDFV